MNNSTEKTKVEVFVNCRGNKCTATGTSRFGIAIPFYQASLDADWKFVLNEFTEDGQELKCCRFVDNIDDIFKMPELIGITKDALRAIEKSLEKEIRDNDVCYKPDRNQLPNTFRAVTDLRFLEVKDAFQNLESQVRDLMLRLDLAETRAEEDAGYKSTYCASQHDGSHEDEDDA